MTDDTKTMLPGLDVTLAEAREVAEASLVRAKARDRRVCLCGHPIARHKDFHGRRTCQPSRMTCACADMTPALEVSDTRLFLRRTSGTGLNHALIKGMYSTTEKDGSVEWLIPVECFSCKATAGVLPVGLRKTIGGGVVIAEENPEATKLLCRQCEAKLSVGPTYAETEDDDE